MTHYCLNVNKRRVNAEHDVLDTAWGLWVEWKWRHRTHAVAFPWITEVKCHIYNCKHMETHDSLEFYGASGLLNGFNWRLHGGQGSSMQKTWQINFFTNLVSATAVNHRLHEYNRLVQPFKGLGSFIKRARSINHAKGWAEGGTNIVGTELV